MPKETITISKQRYDQLIKSEEMLNALEAAGVDNWEGYSEAFPDTENDEDDEDE